MRGTTGEQQGNGGGMTGSEGVMGNNGGSQVRNDQGVPPRGNNGGTTGTPRGNDGERGGPRRGSEGRGSEPPGETFTTIF